MLDRPLEYVSPAAALARRKAHQAKTAEIAARRAAGQPVEDIIRKSSAELAREREAAEHAAREAAEAAEIERRERIESRRPEVMAMVQSPAWAGLPVGSIRAAQEITARRYGITVMDILSARHTANVVLPRHVAMYLSKVLTLRSLSAIGGRFGDRDHTAVLHAIRKIDAMIHGGTVKRYGCARSKTFKPDPAFRADVERLCVEVVEAVEAKSR